MLHSLKILSEYAIPKLRGDKPFEIRFNDRNFQVGDLIRYNCIDNKEVDLKISRNLYHIVYITNYEQKHGYIVFCDKLLNKEN